MIRINYGDDNASDVNKFGQQDVSGSVDMAQNVWDASTYHGGISTRKFPYEVSRNIVAKEAGADETGIGPGDQ